MTTLTAAPLAESQQLLIDARLDTIDRMLNGRVPRDDRLAIVREVESQIHELLADRDPAELSREDVLDVLRRLDPPEAYLPESDERDYVRASRSVVSSLHATTPKPEAIRREGRLGGILGLCSIGIVFLLTPLMYLLGILLQSEMVIFVGVGGVVLLALAGSITALVLSIRGRSQGVMPILGMITASISLPMCLMGSVFLFLALVGGL